MGRLELPYYPTDERGLPRPTEEVLDFSHIQGACQDKQDWHHRMCPRKICLRSEMLTVVRNSLDMQEHLYLDVHRYLNDNFIEPKLLSPRQAMDYVDMVYQERLDLHEKEKGNKQGWVIHKLSREAFRACLNEYHITKSQGGWSWQ